MAELFLLAISAALVQNVVLTYFLGICPFLGVSRRLDMAFGMGAAVTFVTVLAGVMTNFLYLYVLVPLGLTVLQFLLFILVIASVVQLVEMYLRKFFPRLYDAFGVFLPMITANCAILGTCLFINLHGYKRLDQTLVHALFAGLGFTLAIVIMASIREELEHADIPAPFRGAPIALFVAAILAMAFMGFAGIGSSH